MRICSCEIHPNFYMITGRIKKIKILKRNSVILIYRIMDEVKHEKKHQLTYKLQNLVSISFSICCTSVTLRLMTYQSCLFSSYVISGQCTII